MKLNNFSTNNDFNFVIAVPWLEYLLGKRRNTICRIEFLRNWKRTLRAAIPRTRWHQNLQRKFTKAQKIIVAVMLCLSPCFTLPLSLILSLSHSPSALLSFNSVTTFGKISPPGQTFQC